MTLQQRLDRIALAHAPEVLAGGHTSGYCQDCGWEHPCSTYVWATTDRHPLATWNPDDDEDPDDEKATQAAVAEALRQAAERMHDGAADRPVRTGLRIASKEPKSTVRAARARLRLAQRDEEKSQ